MDLQPLAELVREALGPFGLAVLAVIFLLGAAVKVVHMGADAGTAVLRFLREWRA
jgi:hypothetical protein